MATSTTAEQTIDVVTPAAGESVTEGTILEWHAKVGDPIKVDDTIVEISTDKVDVELPSPATGTVSEILAQEGDTVTVGQVIARIVVGDRATERRTREQRRAWRERRGWAVPHRCAPGSRRRLSHRIRDRRLRRAARRREGLPGRRRAAAVEGVDLANVSGSGPDGQIRKADVLSASRAARRPATGAPANGKPAAADGQAELPAAEGRRGGARALHGAVAEIPTATSFRTLTVTVLDARRRELKAGTRKVSFTHLIAYAIAARRERHAGDGPSLRARSRASRTA